jgi:hypothetical protein
LWRWAALLLNCDLLFVGNQFSLSRGKTLDVIWGLQLNLLKRFPLLNQLLNPALFLIFPLYKLVDFLDHAVKGAVLLTYGFLHAIEQGYKFLELGIFGLVVIVASVQDPDLFLELSFGVR